ncbi:MAG: prepilin-type N-terminal cleavage/methylation domain-containing protein [Acidimicrobiia bacterium]
MIHRSHTRPDVRCISPSACPRLPLRGHAGDGGFGLIELIVSLSVFSILFGGVIVTLTAGLGLARSNRERTVAANLASQDLDAVRQADFGDLTPGLSNSNVSVDGVNFTVARNLEWVNASSSSGECDSSGGVPQVLRATVAVSWTNMKTVQPVRTSTVLSPPIGSYDANLGHIAVRVRDSGAAPLGGVPVRVVGSGYDETQTTTGTYAASPGCAFFGFLGPGSYTVTLGTAGYVDRQGAVSPSQMVGVNSGQVASVAFDYDQASTLTLTVTGVNGGTPAAAMAVSLGNTGFLPAGVKAFSGTGATRTLANLFPYTNGYTAWTGDCSDADPEGKNSSGVRYWPSAVRDDAFEVDGGTTTVGTVAAGSVQVNYNRASGSGTVTIVAVHGNDTLCPTGETLTLTTFSTNTGSLLVALPFGTWTIKASGKTPVGSWPTVSLDPTSTTTATANVNI